jgi:hypothetical protein
VLYIATRRTKEDEQPLKAVADVSTPAALWLLYSDNAGR